MSDAEVQAVLETARGTAKPAWTPRLALYIGDPRFGGVEVSGGAYARVIVTFGAPTGRFMLNTNLVQFAAPTATWGLLTHAALIDSASGGVVRHVFLLAGTDEQRTIGVGSTPPSFPAGNIIMGVDLAG